MTIRGLNVRIPAAELSTLLDKAIAHHTERASFYETNAAELKADSQPSRSGDPWAELDRRGRDHRTTARKFSFLNQHLDYDEVYEPSEYEVNSLHVEEDGDAG